MADLIFDYIDPLSFKIENDEKADKHLSSLKHKEYEPKLYSQGDETYSKYRCTLYSALTVMSTIAGIQKDTKYEEQLRDFAKVNGQPPYVEGAGTSIENGAKTAIKFWNQTNELDFVFFQEILESVRTKIALATGMPIQVGIKYGTKTWASESRKGRILSCTTGVEKNSRQHAIAMREIDGEYEFLDSYNRTYRITKELFKQHIIAGTMRPACRIYLPLISFSTLTPEQYKALQAMKNALGPFRNLIDNKESRAATHTYKKELDRIFK